MLLTVALSGLALATEPLQTRDDFIEGWNENNMLANPGTYTAECYAFPYTPSTSYSMTRIEFIGGSGGRDRQH